MIMVRKIICVGTIWDLDEFIYPELDEQSDMTSRNYSYLASHQLSSSMKEMRNAKKLPLFPRNQYGIRVRACCASCLLKEIMRNGRRVCTFHGCDVEALDKCRHWQMSEGLAACGRRRLRNE